MSLLRTRWAAVGAAVAVTLGGGGLVFVDAAQDSGERSVYSPIEPCRLVDTRPNKGIGGRTTPLGPNETFVIDTHGTSGECKGTPADITAVQLNVTPVLPTQATDLTIWPSGSAPNASSLNPAPGQPPTPNAVTSEVTNSGEFRIRNKFGNVHVIVDMVGYYRHHTHDDRYVAYGGTIPSGATVSGNFLWDSHGSSSVSSDAVSVDFPSRAPVPLTNNKVNFNQPGTTGDGDPQCTGTTSAPTAPAGKVCIYLSAHSGMATNTLSGQAGTPMADAGFYVSWMPDGTDDIDQFLLFSWAYTAP